MADKTSFVGREAELADLDAHLASLVRSVAAVRGTVPDREPPRPRLLEREWRG